MHFNVLNTRKCSCLFKVIESLWLFPDYLHFLKTSTMFILMLCNQEKSRWEEKKIFCKDVPARVGRSRYQTKLHNYPVQTGRVSLWNSRSDFKSDHWDLISLFLVFLQQMPWKEWTKTFFPNSVQADSNPNIIFNTFSCLYSWHTDKDEVSPPVCGVLLGRLSWCLLWWYTLPTPLLSCHVIQHNWVAEL